MKPVRVIFTSGIKLIGNSGFCVTANSDSRHLH